MGTMAVVSQVLLALAGIFLMIVVLLQRGRGGGLAGAFGGLGGQSAFGTKAGDVFTRITIVIAIIWVVLAGGSGFFLRASSEERGQRDYGGNETTTDDGTDDASEDGDLDLPTVDPLDVPTADPLDLPTDDPASEGADGDVSADSEASESAESDVEAPTDESPDDQEPVPPEDGASPEE